MLAQLERLEWIVNRCRRTWTLIRERVRREIPAIRFRLSNSDGDLGVSLYLDLQTPELAARFGPALAAEGIPLGPASGMGNLLECDYVRNKRMPHPLLPPFGPGYAGHHVAYAPADAPLTPALLDSMVAVGIGPRYTMADADDIARAIVKVYRAVCAAQ
jgi:hypothetical protein